MEIRIRSAKECWRLVQRHRLAPGRDLRGESEALDLRLDGELGSGFAVHDEHGLRKARVPRALSLCERADPIEKLRLVGMRRESVERPYAAANVAKLSIDRALLHATLQVRAECSFALIANE